jgi:hypothetical protein
MLTVGSDLSSLSKQTAADKSSIADSSVAAALFHELPVAESAKCDADDEVLSDSHPSRHSHRGEFWYMLVNAGVCWCILVLFFSNKHSARHSKNAVRPSGHVQA